MFKLRSKFRPTGDQPKAIEQLTKNLRAGSPHQVLLGVTGSGKTFTLANVIAKIQKPTLVVSHNKTLAAQLYQEFKDFFPDNAVHYFVSYYDYYQPEAYIPQTDTYIEKDAKINEVIDRLRHAAVQDLTQRQDIIVVASVSCIYNLGSPKDYQNVALEIKQGQKIKRQDFIRHLVALQYQRNDIDPKPGAFRTRGEVVEILPASGEQIIRVEFDGEQIKNISTRENSAASGSRFHVPGFMIFPARFWVSPEAKLKIVTANIEKELTERLAELKKQNKLLEAKRLEQRTNYDLEMMRNVGWCHGIENYSRYFEFRKPGEAPFSLLDYFPNDYLALVDESHMTVPQLRAMYNTDRARKEVLIDYGFRLPSALDNRPLKFPEFEKKVRQTIYVSATPGPYEKFKVSSLLADRQSSKLKVLVEQLVRPTGLLEPSIEVRPTKNQSNDLIREIKEATKKDERVLAITLTKRMAEELADYLKKRGVRARYLHSEIKTLDRPEILNKLRKGEIDAIIGINLLREGLDLPEVAMVAILDADKEGFLRNETTLIQTMGRASRHPEGRVILYADAVTGSMKRAIEEVERRRKIQQAYNKKHHITPKAIIKKIKDWPFSPKEKTVAAEFGVVQDIKLLEKEMKTAAGNLDFERAAELRDLIQRLRY